MSQPLSLAVPAGQGATFAVVASGSPTLAYQWRFNGTDIPGATDTNLVVINASSSNAGLYSVQVTNLYGTTNSSNATLTVNYPPTILVHPVSQAALLGSNVAFQVTATGTTPLGYQWRLNGVAVPGGTNATLTISAVQSSNVGAYRAVVTNAGGATTSLVATLSIVYPPIISAHPVSQAALLGSNVAFQVTATGTTALGYQWRLNGIAVPGGTNATLEISGVQSNNVGAYAAVVTNAGGSATTAVATLSIITSPDFLWARNLSNYSPGADHYGFSSARDVASDSLGNVFVTGYFANWSMDFGGFTFTNTAFATNGSSYFNVWTMFLAKYDRRGNFQWVRQAGTNYTTLRVGADPSGNAYLAGWFAGTATFGTNVLVSTGLENLFLAKYDPQGEVAWVRHIVAQPFTVDYNVIGLAVDGGGNVVLTSPYTNSVAFGSVVVTNSPNFLAKYDSSGNLVWAGPAPAVDALAVGPSGAIFLTGSSGYPYSLSPGVLAKYDSSGNLLWSWQFPHGRAITVDAAENIYATGYGSGIYGEITVTNVGGIADFFVAKCSSDGHALWVRQIGSVWEQWGTAISVDAVGKVYVTSISANRRPEPLLVFGDSILTNAMSFVAKYDGNGNVLWAKSLANGLGSGQPASMAFTDPQQVYIAGTIFYSQSFGNFNLTNDSPGHFEDLYIAKLAAEADVTPPPPPVPAQIVGQPKSQVAIIGGNPTFNVTAYGGVPLSYQWFFNGTNSVGGATDSGFTVTNAQIANAGNYTAVVTNAYGSATSAVATLTVYPADGGTLSSPSIFSTNHQVRFNVAGIAGLNYAVQASSNLVNWVYLSTNTSPFLFTDPNAGNFARRYYRSIYIP